MVLQHHHSRWREVWAKKIAQTFAIRCLGSPQTTILYGKSAPYRHNDPNENSITRLRYEVVIRQRLS